MAAMTTAIQWAHSCQPRLGCWGTCGSGARTGFIIRQARSIQLRLPVHCVSASDFTNVTGTLLIQHLSPAASTIRLFSNMRFLTSITLAALSGLAAAASQQSADVFILDSKQQQEQSSREVPRLPKEVVRHILLQRASQTHVTRRVKYLPKSDLTCATGI